MIRKFVLLMALVTLVLAACAAPVAPAAPSEAAPAAPAAAQTPANTIVAAVPNEPTTWDYDFVQGDLVGLSLVKNVDPFLLDHPVVDSGEGYLTLDTTQLLGVYADSYTISEDGLTWTITLKEGLTFPNGDPITAETFRASKERGLNFQANIGFVYGTIGITPENMTVIDDLTLEIKHNSFSSLQPYMHAIGSFFYDPKTWEENGSTEDPWATDWKSKNPGSGGPYSVAEIVAGQRIVLEANPNWPGEVANERVEVQIVPSASNRVLMLQRGDVDIAFGLGRRDVLALEGTEGVKILSIPSTDAVMLVLNHSMPPFDNPDFRKAVAYALPYEDILSGVYGGNATAMKSVMPNGMPGYTEAYWVYDTDMAAAQAALAASGVQNATIDLTIEAGVAEHEQIALLVQNALSEIGITVNIQELDATTIAEQRAQRALPFLVHQGISWINDPEYHFNLSLAAEGFLNFGDYNNPRITEIIQESAQIVDAAERFAAYDEAQMLAMEDLPYIPLAQPNYVVAMRDNVQGYTYAADQLYRFWTMSKE
jgi:peptide/nickel transport system substrate-binding protein